MVPSALVGLLLLGQPQQSGVLPKQAISASKEKAYDLLLMDVLYDGLRLQTTLSALQDEEGRRYLPFKQISAALGFRLKVDVEKGLARGFLSSPSDKASFDARAGAYKRKSTSSKFNPALCFQKDGELYVDADVLSTFAGLRLFWRLNRLELEVQADAPLALRRQQRQANTFKPADKPVGPLETITTPYRPWSLPSVDVQLYSASEGGEGQTQRTSRLSFDAVGDLFFMSARYRLTTGTDGRPDARLTLSREDPRANLLGPLHASRITFGDLNMPPLGLLSRGRGGIGVSFSNFPVAGQDSTSLTDLDGRAAPHSSIELYRDDLLIGVTRSDADGRYVFGSLPLESGPNVFRVVSVSIDGDVTEEERTIYGDRVGPKRGEGRYRFTMGKIGSSLLGGRTYAAADSDGRFETIAEYQWGLSSSSWLSATAADFEGAATEGRFLGLGYHAWNGRTQWHLQTMASDAGGSAFSAGASRRLGNATISLEHTHLMGSFQSGIFPEVGADADSVTKLRLDGVLGFGNRPISYGLSVDRFDGSNASTLLRGRLSGGSRDLFFSNSLVARLARGPFEASGLFQVRKRFGKSSLRFDLGYGLGELGGIRTSRLTFDKRISVDYRMQYGLEYDVSRAATIAAIGTLYRMIGPLALGLHLSVDQRGGLKASLLLGAALTPGDSFGQVELSRSGIGEMGSVYVRVFLDKNLSGQFDEGDVLLPDIGIRVSGRPAPVRTSRAGTCTLDRLQPNAQVALTVNEDTFEDPCWISGKPGILAVPRPGNVVRVDFPVIEAAEIEGRLLAVDLAAHPGLVAELLAAGQVAHTSILDASGGYVFSRVRPGNYILRLTDLAGSRVAERSVKVLPGAQMRDCDIRPTQR